MPHRHGHPRPDRVPTLAAIVRAAVAAVDPDGEDERLTRLEEQLEDADEPVVAGPELDQRLALAVEGADVELNDPFVALATAVVRYLAQRPGELGERHVHLLREAARSEWRGDPPEDVVALLAGGDPV